MIRTVIAVKFKVGTTSAQVKRLIDAMQAVQVDGMRHLDCGTDLGLKDGNWDYALTADFDDQDAYTRYDLDPEHNRIRREIAGGMTESAVRVQFHLSD